MYLLDTNVISELRKSPGRVHPQVDAWAVSVQADQTFLSVLTLGELRRGIEKLRVSEPERAGRLDIWFEHLARYQYAGRILDVDRDVVDRWGRFGSAHPAVTMDGLIAATALVHNLTVVTRNTRHFVHTQVPTLDPWLPRGA